MVHTGLSATTRVEYAPLFYLGQSNNHGRIETPSFTTNSYGLKTIRSAINLSTTSSTPSRSVYKIECALILNNIVMRGEIE